MKVTVAALFRIYQMTEKVRRESLNSRVIKKNDTSYGKALVAGLATTETLENCQTEIELSPETINSLLSFNQIAPMSALSGDS